MQGNSNQIYLISISMLNVKLEGKKTVDHLYCIHRNTY
jgi:hypothetical protein